VFLPVVCSELLHDLLNAGENVMLDSDLAELYGVETGHLVRAMKRNEDRFPADFSFQWRRRSLKI
jgi:hypothetical protein